MAERIDYYASLNSPWTHLGAARLLEVADRCGATVRVCPFDVIATFSASGGLPLPKRSPQRQAYRFQELERWRRFLGIPIQLKPKFFPAKEAAAAHCILAVRETIGDRPAIDLTHRVLKALWEEDADTGDILAYENFDRATLAKARMASGALHLMGHRPVPSE